MQKVAMEIREQRKAKGKKNNKQKQGEKTKRKWENQEGVMNVFSTRGKVLTILATLIHIQTQKY